VTSIGTLEEAREESSYGAKAIGLGEALRAGLPVPPGIALDGPVVDDIAAGEPEAVRRLTDALAGLPTPLAVRSSCVGEDSAQASFAGQHVTLLNVRSADDVPGAIQEIWWSANSDSAITYRQRVGLVSRPSVGVVVQSLLDPDVAGVMFTRNPVTGADERVIEASWGLGEAVVAGRVIPDSYRVSRTGEVLDVVPGLKKIAIRPTSVGGTVDEEVASELVERPCLDNAQLAQLAALAVECERVYGDGRDIEWAFASGTLYLLQCRAVTRAAGVVVPQQAVPDAAPVEMVSRVPLFADLDEAEAERIARAFKKRRFAAGETVTKEGAGAAAFFIIESGVAAVTVKGEPRRSLEAGDYFGEIALIDEGARSATVTAATDLVCHGLTVWDFRPLVQQNSVIAWKLLQALARRLRAEMDR